MQSRFSNPQQLGKDERFPKLEGCGMGEQTPKLEKEQLKIA